MILLHYCNKVNDYFPIFPLFSSHFTFFHFCVFALYRLSRFLVDIARSSVIIELSIDLTPKLRIAAEDAVTTT